MEYEEYGSADYSDDSVPTEVPSNATDAISLWLVFGGCVFAALVINECPGRTSFHPPHPLPH